MKRAQKIYYSPGVISLVLLPILLLWHLNREGAFQKYSVIEVYSFYPNQNLKEFAPYFKNKVLKNNFTEIILTGNKKEDLTKLNFAQLRIREIKTSTNIEAIRFNFKDNSKYWAFIHAIDLCQIEKINWVLFNNEVWCFNMPNELTKNTLEINQNKPHLCGNTTYVQTPLDAPPPQNINRFYPLLIIFILMIIGATIKIYNRHFNSNTKH